MRTRSRLIRGLVIAMAAVVVSVVTPAVSRADAERLPGMDMASETSPTGGGVGMRCAPSAIARAES